MDRRTMLWALVAFFGASVAFGIVRDATADESVGVTLALQVVVLVAIVLLILVLVRRSGRR